MQTCIPEKIRNSTEGQAADQILRTCVHCGFCTATCPTYQLLGDELDGPRGRIYLIKQVFEGEKPTRKTLTHLDRCLTCRSCETTCPSGVKYAHLLDLGRHFVEQQVHRSVTERLMRNSLHLLLSTPVVFNFLYRLASAFTPGISKAARSGYHGLKPRHTTKNHPRKVILLEGCVQPVMRPGINAATIRVLDELGIQIITHRETECCGAISHHLNKQKHALKIMRNNIDTWWSHIDNGCEAIISNASGCGITLKEYGQYLAHDPAYAKKAEVVSQLVRDISEIISEKDIAKLQLPETVRVAFHSPCTLQHGLRLSDHVEDLLRSIGCELLPINDSHLCCGSAGTYSILQPRLSRKLKKNKLQQLQEHSPRFILTANIGCQHHLASGTDVPVIHWIELVAGNLDKNPVSK